MISFIYLIFIFSGNITKLLDEKIIFSQKIVNIIQISLIFSLIFSSILYFIDNMVAYILYLPQFILRIVFFMTTISYIVRLNYIFKNQNIYMLLAVISILFDIIRLIYSVYEIIRRKRNLTTASTWLGYCHGYVHTHKPRQYTPRRLSKC